MADRIKGITIEIGGDTTGLNKALSGVNKEIRDTQGQLKDVERLLKLDPSNTELLKQKQKLLSDAVGGTADKLETLKKAEKQVQQQFAEGKVSEEQYDALKREIIATEQQLDALKEKAAGANVALQKLGLAGDKVKDFGGKVTSIGQGMTKVSAGITAIGTASVAAWKTVDEAYDTIAKGTGATGKDLKDLQKSFDNVYSSIPAEAGAAGSAIADINTRFGFTGEALEDCTRSFLQFAEVNNTDVSAAIANVSRYMGDAGIEAEQYGSVLDQLTAASQASGISVDKLSENLTKYGAPMRALGLTTEESIAIFAGWEKAGVNTEIAFSGMKKAIGTWGKAGKDAGKEFKKTLDEIKKCPDIASATTKAIEVFGQKAGPDLADAIQGGRFEFEDFLQVVENSKGQLEQTFNDTLDPIDEVKVKMQGLTTQGAELGGMLLSTLVPMLTRLIGKVEEVTAWFGSLSESQKETAVKAALVVAAIGPVLIALGKVITAVGSIMTMISGLGTSLIALSASGGPLFLAVLAVSALASAFILAADHANSYEEKIWEVSEAEQENIDKVEELGQSYEELSDRRRESISAIDSQVDHENRLWKELQNITDENGKVKAGYEDRAAFITQTLADALGIEIEMTDGIIKGYQELQGEIDGLIEKKRQEAVMNAYQEEYMQAVKDRKDAQQNLADAVSSSQEAADGYNKSLEEGKALQKEYNRLMEQYAEDGTNDEIRQQLYDLQDQMIASGEATEGFREKMETMNGNLGKAQKAWEGINSTIANYEGASAAIISGDREKIREALMLLEHDFKTAKTSTKESLQAQHEAIKTELSNAKKAMADGVAGMDEEYISGLEQMEMKARIEFDKVAIAAGKASEDAANEVKGKRGNMLDAAGEFIGGLSKGIRDKVKSVEDAAAWAAEAGSAAAREALGSQASSSDVARDIGKEFDTGYAKGIRENVKPAADAVDGLIAESTAGMEQLPEKGRVWATDFMDGYISAMRGKLGDLARASEQVAGTIASYLHFTRPDEGPLREYDVWPRHMMQGLAQGITDNIGTVGSAAEAAAGRIGRELAEGLADSVRSNKDNAKKSAEELADAVLKAAKKKLSNEEVYRKLSLANEVDYWDAVRKQISEGTQARIDADDRYLKAKKDLNDQLASLEESYTEKVANSYKELNDKVQRLNEQYRNSVNQRAEQISSSFGLFDEFDMSTDLTADDLLNNLQGQVEGLQKWRSNLRELEQRGVSDELLAELQEFGPKAAAEIQLMTEMSDAQLDEYVGLFREKNRIARRQAMAELEPMRDDIADQIGKLQQETAAELSKYQQEYLAAMKELGVSLSQPLETMKVTAAQNAAALVTTMADTIRDASGSEENVDKFKRIAENVLGATNTLRTDMRTVGQNTILDIIDGMQSKAEMLYATAQEIAQKVTQVMAETFEIQMPNNLSRGTYDMASRAGGDSHDSRVSSAIMELLDSYLPEIAQQKSISIDGKALVGETVGDMDNQISGKQAARGRATG